MSIYIDGLLDSRHTRRNFPPHNGSFPVQIGATCGTGLPFPGVIDELTLYNRALSAAEIGAVFTAANNGKRLTPHAAEIWASGSVAPGSTPDLHLTARNDPNSAFLIASALCTGSVFGLCPDALLQLTAFNLAPGVFRNYRGTMDAQGRARAAIAIPPGTALLGLEIYTVFLTLSPSTAVKSISTRFAFRISTCR